MKKINAKTYISKIVCYIMAVMCIFTIINSNSKADTNITTYAEDKTNKQFWPVYKGILGYPWGDDSDYGGWHTGIDIWSTGDDTIYSSTNGTVIAVYNSCPHWSYGYGDPHTDSYGNSVWIKDENGHINIYGHLAQNSIKVNVGDIVKKETPLATMGSSGWSTGKHLHYEKRVNGYNANTNPDVEIKYYYEFTNGFEPKIIIENQKSTYDINTKIRFIVSANNADYYTIGIDCNGQRIKTKELNSNTTYDYTLSKAGKYTAYVTAGNYNGEYEDSSKISFTVKDVPITTTTKTTTATTTKTTTTTTKATTTTKKVTTTTVTTTKATTTTAQTPIILPKELTMKVNETETVYLINGPEEESVFWISNNKNVVIVNNCKITAVGKGNATIYAVFNDTYVELPVFVESETVTLIGDANCDSKVTIADAVAIQQYLANTVKYPLSAQGLINADFDCDGITALDALIIQKMDAGA